MRGPLERLSQNRRLFFIKNTAVWFCIFFVGCWGGDGRAPDPFALPLNYPAGKKPNALITYDMNLDGFPDILVTDAESSTLYYFEGVGNGTFKEPAMFKTGREPVALAAGDFNGDGVPDLAVSNYGDGSISIIIGQKDGIFKMKDPVPVGRLPIAIVAGDFDNDQKLDLAVTLRFDKLVILLGTGDGQFKTGEPINASGTPSSMAAGYFDSDKNLDLAIAFSAVKTEGIQVFYGKGDGTFKPPQHVLGGGQSSFIRPYDMNQDGMADLVVSNTTRDSLTLFLGNGKGDFQKMPDFAAERGPGSFVAGEFTGDRFLDLVVCNQDGSISVLEGKGDGSFIFPHYNYPVGKHPGHMVAADFNRDGLTDLALLSPDNGLLEIIMRKTSVAGTEDN